MQRATDMVVLAHDMVVLAHLSRYSLHVTTFRTGRFRLEMYKARPCNCLVRLCFYTCWMADDENNDDTHQAAETRKNSKCSKNRKKESKRDATRNPDQKNIPWCLAVT